MYIINACDNVKDSMAAMTRHANTGALFVINLRESWRSAEAIDLLIEPVEVEDADLAEEVAGFHCREHSARLADHLEDAVCYNKHLSRYLALATYRVARREYVGLHL